MTDLNVTTKLGLYALGLVAVFAAMFGIGSLVGPVLPEGAPEHSESAERALGGGPDHEDTHDVG